MLTSCLSQCSIRSSVFFRIAESIFEAGGFLVTPGTESFCLLGTILSRAFLETAAFLRVLVRYLIDLTLHNIAVAAELASELSENRARDNARCDAGVALKKRICLTR